ncbi:Hypothetical protein R9X50_00382600 [Acrodontium crateriforme]|uniref:Chromo domain-containing protein n=1 Tax=Acrodontium crateriforme TaxID=150365 RepID=A0AAQ3M9U8_9PEZI|nr:Hypothetical protein R9X50_00382600 [Acrodontium crateriforme]
MKEIESEEDSVRTDTTAESEPEDDYQVERILLEHEGRRDNKGQREYLIKWQNYPLHRATWEPEHHIDSPSILIEWAQQKAQIQAGKAEPFNEKEYHEALDKAETAREDREKRRAKKRQRRIEKALAKKENDRDYENENESIDESDEENGPGVEEKSRRRLVRRRRAAANDDESEDDKPSFSNRRLKKTKRLSLQADSDDEKFGEREDSSLMLRDKHVSVTDSSQAPQPSTQQSPATQAHVCKPSIAKVATDLAPLTIHEAKLKGVSNVPVSARKDGSLLNSNAAASQTAGRKSAPSNIFIRRQRPIVYHETPKDLTEFRFQKLSTQNRVQKLSRNEPAPDPTKLIMINPKTGKSESPMIMVAPASAEKSKEPPIAYGRRSPQPDRRRTISPPSPPPAPMTMNMSFPTNQTPAPMQPNGDRASQKTIRLVDPRKFASYDDALKKKDLACFFWSTSRCTKPEEECEYAHQHTGLYASPPAAYRGSTNEVTIKAAIARNMNRDDKQRIMMSDEKHERAGRAIAPQNADPRQGGRADSFPPKRTTPPRQNSEDSRQERSINNSRSAVVGVSGTTCYYWYERGHCSKNSCLFAHYDTGIYAGPPGTFKNRKSNECYFWESDGQCHRGDRCPFVHRGVGSVDKGGPTGIRERSTIADATLRPFTQSPVSYHQQDQISNSQAGTPEARNEAPPEAPISTTTIDPMYLTRWTPQSQPSRNSNAPPPQYNPAGTTTETNFSEKTTLARIEIVFSSAAENVTFDIQLQMTESSTVAFKSMCSSLTENIHLKFDCIVLATDFRQYVPNFLPESSTTWPSGNILYPSESAQVIARIAEFMKLRAAAFVLVDERFTMVLYPNGADEWKFLDGPALASSQSRLLRFRVGPPLLGESHDETANRMTKLPIKTETAVAVGEKAGLDSSDFQPSNSHQQGVFILMPPSHQIESEFLIKYFQGLKFKVYHSGTAGSWSYFQKKYPKKSVVVVHPLIKLWTIPRLYHYMAEGRGGIRIFSIGLQIPFAPDVATQNLVYCSRRLFPSSSVTLITDEIFAYHPDQAAQVIRHFIRKNVKDKPPAAQISKIVVRPRFLDWVYRLVVDRLSGCDEIAAQPWVDMLEAVTTLCPPEARDPIDPSSPLESSLLVSDALWIEYADMWDNDNTAATKQLVEWFASWTALQSAYVFRRIEVCYKPKNDDASTIQKSVVEEAEVYQHMQVLSPETLLAS